MRDFDYHPDEETVRCFGIPDSGILVNDEHACVNQTRQPDVFQPQSDDLVLRHYAFADEWFKLNATFDLEGNLIQPGPPETAMAVNCDIATPMVRVGDDVSAVDLFLDVFVRTDGSYRIADRDEFEQAAADGLVSQSEAHSAETGLTRLMHWIESGRLLSLLAEIEPTVTATAPPPLPFERVSPDLVPSVARGTRGTW